MAKALPVPSSQPVRGNTGSETGPRAWAHSAIQLALAGLVGDPGGAGS